MRVIVFIFLCSSILSGFSQPKNPNDTLLQWIASLQVQSDPFYNNGLFRSQRMYRKHVYQDNTLFYSSLIALTLNSLVDKSSKENDETIEEIYEGVKSNALRYQSRRGRPTFNYWQTNPDIPHPNGPARYQTDKYKVPDDFDDTSMIGLLLDSPEFSLEIRNEMVRYTAERKKKVKTTFNRLKHSKAYGVWFADKWKQEFDISVMANTLGFVFENGFALNQYDSASIEFIKRSIADDLHKKQPFVLSPYYTKTAVILYHIARLLASDTSGLMEVIKPKIISDIYEELDQAEMEMHQVILYTSLYRLGEHPDVQIDVAQLKAEEKEFRWFSANFMLAIGSGTFLRKTFHESRIVPTFYWRCDAYYWTLYWEYLITTSKTQ